MPSGDEENIRTMLAVQAKKRHTIHNEVMIDGKKHVFSERAFLDIFTMVVPESFADMPEDLAEVKYSSIHRPKIILTNENGTVNINLSHERGSGEAIGNRAKNYRGLVKRLNPSNVFFSHGVFDVDGLAIRLYDFRSPALEKDIYNLHALFDIGNTEMFLGFNCPFDMQKQWEPLVREMIKTIKPLPEKED